jgi:hypothetical protein
LSYSNFENLFCPKDIGASACDIFEESTQENGMFEQVRWICVVAFVVFGLSGCKSGDGGEKPAEKKTAANAEAGKNSSGAEVSTCTGEQAGACLTLGVRLQTGEDGQKKDVKKALALFQMTCDGGDDVRGCTLAAHLYKDGKDGIEKDEKKALALYEKACEGDDKVGCFRAGNAYGIGQLGAETDPKKAYKYLSKACEKGDKDACKFAGMVKKTLDQPTPASVGKKCLEEKDTESCNTAAMNHRKGARGFEKDIKKAAEMLAISCGEKKDKNGCTLLGLIHEKGELTGTPDGAKAGAAYTEACSAGGLIACRVLGKHYLIGKLLPKDPAKAKPVLEKACNGSELQGCTWLGMMYRNGLGVAQDAAKATSFLTKACDGGDKTACDLLKAK